jgi:hypothetical protein
MSGPTPAFHAGLSPKEFKLMAVEVGQWLWGTAQGAFNEKQTMSQIITDAVIGMIPLVGDVTAVRDLIAVSTGLATNPAKREHTMEWVLLVIFIFALIPVLGGVIKGVGRIALRVTEEAAKDSVAIAKIAEETIAFLNRFGHKNAEAWLKALDVMKYQGEILSKFRAFCDTVILAINKYALRFSAVLPQSLIARMEQLSEGFKQIKVLGDKMIPQALKDLHERLETLKKYVHAGGVPPPDKAKTLLAQTGQKTVTYAEEARLVESSAAKKIVRGGKYQQNVANANPKYKDAIDKIYKQEPGFPDLLKSTKTVDELGVTYYPAIAAATGPIKNEMLSGETLFRSFGQEGSTHGVKVKPTEPIGFWWGRGAPPKTAEEWRQKYAVLDEFNRNGWLSIIHIPTNVKIPASTSTVSEQFGKELTAQYLEGGGKQAAILFDDTIKAEANGLFLKGGGKVILENGIEIEIRQSGWKGINGKIGYADAVIPGASVTERLGVTEIQKKVGEESVKQSAVVGAAKEQRSHENKATH